MSLQLHGSVRKMSSHVRMDTASGACGIVMVTMTVVTTAMSNVVSNVAIQILPCQYFKRDWTDFNFSNSRIP